MNVEKRVLPPIYFLIALAVMIGLYFIFPIARGVPPPYNYLGVLPIVVGALMVIWAANFFSKVGTTIKPFRQSTQLVTRGLYKYTRNPMYLGMAFILIGIAICLGKIAPFFIIPLFIGLIQQNFIRMEEKALQDTFGDEYAEYKKRARRWI